MNNGWTTKELQILRDHFPTTNGVAEWATLLPGRGWDAIKVRANKMGLKMVRLYQGKKNSKHNSANLDAMPKSTFVPGGRRHLLSPEAKRNV